MISSDAEELEWYVPQAIVPQELERNLRLIDQYLADPLDLEGKKAASLLHKKPQRRRRRRATADSSDEEAAEDEPRRKRKEKKKKEAKHYKSAQFIEDSDVEADELEAFFAQEKALREKMALAAASSGTAATMLATGTKKRKKNMKEGKGKDKAKKKRKRDDGDSEQGSGEEQKEAARSDESDADSDDGLFNPFASPKIGPSTAHTSPGSDAVERHKPKPRPRPRPAKRAMTVEVETDGASLPPSSPSPRASSVGSRAASPLVVSSDDDNAVVRKAPLRRKPLFLSDEED